MRWLACFSTIALAAGVWAGPFASAGVAASDPNFKGWATATTNLTRGPIRIDNPGLGLASFGSGALALGTPGGSTDAVSLGDGGSITVTFAKALRDGSGADFAVFEQGFVVGPNQVYAELGFVEVSSDGVNFFRFQATSLTPSTQQVGSFGAIDPTDIHNLAGQFAAFQGTPFDLGELRGTSAALDVDRVTHVRIVDVVGSVLPDYARLDAMGRVINDPWPTPFASSGFDLDAVGALNVVPEPGTLLVLAMGAALLRKRRA